MVKIIANIISIKISSLFICEHGLDLPPGLASATTGLNEWMEGLVWHLKSSISSLLLSQQSFKRRLGDKISEHWHELVELSDRYLMETLYISKSWIKMQGSS